MEAGSTFSQVLVAKCVLAPDPNSGATFLFMDGVSFENCSLRVQGRQIVIGEFESLA